MPDPRDAVRSGAPGLDIDAVTSLVSRQLGTAKAPAPGGLALLTEAQAQAPPDRGNVTTLTLPGEAVPEQEDFLFQMRLSRALDGEDILLLLDKTPRYTASQVAAVCHKLANKRGILDEEFSDDARLLAFAAAAGLQLSRNAPGAASAASLLWSISLLRFQLPVLEDLIPGVCLAFPDAAQDMNLGNLTASLTAVARMRRDLPEVMEIVQPLLQGITDRVYDMEALHIASTIWAAGDIGLDHTQLAPLLDALVPDLSMSRLSTFNTKELTNLLWGLTQLGYRGDDLMARIAQAATKQMKWIRKTMAAVNIPKLICGFARQRFEAVEFRQAAAVRLLQKRFFREVNDWGICALAWSWPRPDEEGLSSEVRRVGELLAHQLSSRELTSRQVARGWEAPQDWYDTE